MRVEFSSSRNKQTLCRGSYRCSHRMIARASAAQKWRERQNPAKAVPTPPPAPPDPKVAFLRFVFSSPPLRRPRALIIAAGPDPDVAEVDSRMSLVKHKILVLSGKGGVGKSTFSSQLAFALASDMDTQGLSSLPFTFPRLSHDSFFSFVRRFFLIDVCGVQWD